MNASNLRTQPHAEMSTGDPLNPHYQPPVGTGELVSVLIPAFNESGAISDCLLRTASVFGSKGIPLELVLVDDGSTDATVDVARKTKIGYGRLRIVRYERNQGKTAAIRAGLSCSNGSAVALMDADLQYDPADLIRLLALVRHGYGGVTGWRVHREDKWSKTLPSKLFNWVMRQSFGIPIHDFNCGLKVFNRNALLDIVLDGDMHRFLIPLVHQAGYPVGELPVHHFPRMSGSSKFGGIRLLTGSMDLVGLKSKLIFGLTYRSRVSRLWRLMRFRLPRKIVHPEQTAFRSFASPASSVELVLT